MSYTKLANSILTSTIWMEDDHTRIAWLALLAMADKNGEVQASIPGLANVARIPVESCRLALKKFMEPDPDSRTKDDEGRRIEEIKGGWMLINHADYRALASDEDRKSKAAERQQRVRDRKRRNDSATVTPPSHQISEGWCDESRQNPQAEAEAEAEALKEEECPPNPQGGFSLSVDKYQKPDPSRTAIGKLLGRRESTKWSNDEIRLLKSIGEIHPDDMDLMRTFYGAEIPKDEDYRRTTIERLLKHWNGELDKARAYKLSKR